MNEAETRAELIDPAGVARIEQLVAEQKLAAEAGDSSRFYALDEAFHRAIADCVECDPALRVVESARAQTDRVRYLSLPDASPLALLIAQHEAILDAIKARDPERAEAAMRTHLREILSALPRLAERFPDVFDRSDVPPHARPMAG